MSLFVKRHTDPSFYFKFFTLEGNESDSLLNLGRLGVNRGAHDWNFHDPGKHRHCIYYNSEPGASIAAEGRVYQLKPGRAVWISSGTPFDASTIRPTHHAFIEFSQTPLTQVLTGVHEINVEPALAELFRKFSSAVIAEDQTSTICLATAIIHLVALEAGMRFRPLPIELSRLIASISEGGFRDTTTSLASRAGYSLVKFRRWFSELLGVMPAAFIREMQVSEAVRQLRGNEKSIDQIAQDCGFPNRYYLSRVFARSVGMGPGTYRKKALQAGSRQPSDRAEELPQNFLPDRRMSGKWHRISMKTFVNRRWDGPDSWFGDIPLQMKRRRLNILGVPFSLGAVDAPSSFVLLHSTRLPSSRDVEFPRELTIPLQRQGSYLYILHSAGWVKKQAHAADYILHFSDGKRKVVPVWALENEKQPSRHDIAKSAIGDWFTVYQPLRNSRCVTYGLPTRMGDPRSLLYILKIVNPRPQVEMTSITFRVREGNDIPIAVLGLTLFRYNR